MESQGVPYEEIPKFSNPEYWLEYFPPRAIEDLKRLGVKVDWRRSFITTDKNPYFDSFIRWQFNCLKEQELVRFGKRYTIISTKDNQPCQDHDRASGEGVNPQEYIGLMFRILPNASKASETIYQLIGSNNENLFLIAATLRPETIYGLTNIWASSDIEYVAFRHVDGWIGICTERALINGSYQGWASAPGAYEIICSIPGSLLMGVGVEPPANFLTENNSPYQVVYVLPFLNLLPDKGTGIVASVPSDSPDDYAALFDLQQKPGLRSKFGLLDEMVIPFAPIGIVQTQGYSSPLLAQELCSTFNVRSQNDKEALSKAKAAAYKDGFYSGIMLTGSYSGKSVSEAKPLIKMDLINAKKAIPYCEPEAKVVARTGDECVVALMDQWYIAYGEPIWKEKVIGMLSQMELFHEETQHQMDFIINWLGQWACARSFGLGSRLPWDPNFLIESLSDSTIYMAYYTVSHFLQNGTLDGRSKSNPISPTQMTDAVWGFLFDGNDSNINEHAIPTPVLASGIACNVLLDMKKEFSYWYPMDLRVSGKDLLFNHLTFMLYVHAALFPSEFWPRGMRVNGHLLLNAAKMSKSTGNFMTLSDALVTFSADATRFTLADAGDGLDDANFSVETANAAILKLYTILEWTESIICGKGVSESFRAVDSELHTFDLIMLSRIDEYIQKAYDAYDKMLYREALKWAFHELVNARDRYRELCSTGHGMHAMVIDRFIRVQSTLMYPITSHFSEYVLTLVDKKEHLDTRPKWPCLYFQNFEFGPLLAMDNYVTTLEHRVRAALGSCKKGEDTFALIIALEIPAWQKLIIELLESLYYKDEDSCNLIWKEEDARIVSKLHLEFKTKIPLLPREIAKKIVPWMIELKKRVEMVGPSAFRKTLLFDEVQTLGIFSSHLKNALNVSDIHIATAEYLSNEKSIDSAFITLLSSKSMLAIPGEPTIICYKSDTFPISDLTEQLMHKVTLK